METNRQTRRINVGTRVLVAGAFAAASLVASWEHISESATRLSGGTSLPVRVEPAGAAVINAEGQIVYIDAAEATRGYVEGRYRIPGGRIPVRFPDHGVGTIDAVDLPGTIRDGGSLASNEELAYARESRLRREYNPGSALTGTFIGIAVLFGVVFGLLSLVRVNMSATDAPTHAPRPTDEDDPQAPTSGSQTVVPLDTSARQRRIEEAEARTAARMLPAGACSKRRDRGGHERGDRGKCLYCDVPLAASDAERWWCEHCQQIVPSAMGRCAKCKRAPTWR